MADFAQLETRRLELEENVAKLRKSLQHWRTWDAEYEGLKEELSSGVNVQSETDCVSDLYHGFKNLIANSMQARISERFGGELVNEKGLTKKHARLRISL